MPGFSEAIDIATKFFVCKALEIEEPATRWLSDAFSAIPGSRSIPFSEQDREPYERARRAACGVASPPGGSAPGAVYPPPPPTGGQCPTLYRVNLTVRSIRNGVPRNDINTGIPNVLGPIQGPFLRPGGASSNQVCVVDVNGNDQCVYGEGGLSGTVTDMRFEDVTFTRLDGGPDNCDPPPPPTRPEGDGVLDYDDEDGNPISEPYDIVGGAPRYTPDGTVYIPVEFCFAAVCIDVDFNLSTGDVNFNFGGAPGASECCPPLEDSEDLPPDPDDPPPPADERRLWGVKVNCVVDENVTTATQIGDGGPVLWVPRLAVVRFAVEVDGNRSWTVDQPVKTTSQFVPVNVPAVAYDFTVIADPGVTTSVVPVYVAEPQ